LRGEETVKKKKKKKKERTGKRKLEARETDGSCRSSSKCRPTGGTAKEDFHPVGSGYSKAGQKVGIAKKEVGKVLIFSSLLFRSTVFY
jgi:hypothetical protein